MASTIRMDEWAKALEELESRSAEGFTTEEMSEATGYSVKTTLLRIAALMRAGKLRMAGARTGRGINGRLKHTPVYQLVQEANGDKPRAR